MGPKIHIHPLQHIWIMVQKDKLLKKIMRREGKSETDWIFGNIKEL